MHHKTNKDEREYEYCPEKGKRIFHTRGEAERAVREVRAKRKGEQSVYQCPCCGYYHTTSTSYQKSKDIRQGKIHHAGVLYEF